MQERAPLHSFNRNNSLKPLIGYEDYNLEGLCEKLFRDSKKENYHVYLLGTRQYGEKTHRFCLKDFDSESIPNFEYSIVITPQSNCFGSRIIPEFYIETRPYGLRLVNLENCYINFFKQFGNQYGVIGQINDSFSNGQFNSPKKDCLLPWSSRTFYSNIVSRKELDELFNSINEAHSVDYNREKVETNCYKDFHDFIKSIFENEELKHYRPIDKMIVPLDHRNYPIFSLDELTHMRFEDYDISFIKRYMKGFFKGFTKREEYSCEDLKNDQRTMLASIASSIGSLYLLQEPAIEPRILPLIVLALSGLGLIKSGISLYKNH